MSFSLRLLPLLPLCFAACSTGGSNPPDRDMAVVVNDMATVDAKAPGPPTACAPRAVPIRISALPGDHQSPRLTYTGVNDVFVVAWNTGIADESGLRHRIDAQLVSGDGQKLGPNLPISPDTIADDSPPTLAAVTSGTIVGWARRTGDATDVVVSTIDSNGQKLQPNGSPCNPAALDCGMSVVTTSGTVSQPYLGRPVVNERTAVPTENVLSLTWVDTRNYPCEPEGCLNLNDIYWKKIQANGTELIPERRITAVGANRRNNNPRMAFDGTYSGIVYRDDTGVLVSDMYFAAVDSLGLMATSPTKFGSAAGSGLQVGGPDLIYSSDSYALVSIAGSTTQASVVFQRLQSTGQSALLPRGISFGGVACTPTVAWNGENYAVAWQTDCSVAGSDLAFVLVDKTGVRIKPDGTSCIGSFDDDCGVQTITASEGTFASYPELTWAGGSNFGITWMERQGRDAGSAPADIMFSAIDCKPF